MFAAVILAGGAARRVGGAAKPALEIGGRTLVRRVLDAVPDARPRIVVGPPEFAHLLPAGVILTREEPPGGGPVAAIAAGLSAVASPPVASPPVASPPVNLGEPTTAYGPEVTKIFEGAVAVLAGDLPFLAAAIVESLALAADGFDGAVLVDEAGRPQWLAGVWRLESLVERLAALGDPAGRAMRHLLSDLRVAFVPVSEQPGPPPWFDCDTDDDLRRAEEWARADTG